MALSAFSETNLANSVSETLAAQLLAAGYLVYWYAADAVQTLDGWYYGYRANAATYLADATFKARLDAARGILSLKGKTTAIPEYPVRPTNDGTVPAVGEVGIPELVVEVGPWDTGDILGLGDRMRTRTRHLAIYGLARDVGEQSWLRDALATWFDEETVLSIYDHDAGTHAYVGDTRTTLVGADSLINRLVANATTYEVILNARLAYEA
jgi:hypothetical protein